MILQFILFSHFFATQIRHSHNLDNQARPTSKVLGTLSLSGLRVILLPRKSCLLPALIDGVDQVLAEFSVHLCGAGTVGARRLCEFLGEMLVNGETVLDV